MKLFLFFCSFSALLLSSCTSGEVNDDTQKEPGIDIVFADAAKTSSSSLPSTVSFDRIEGMLKDILKSEEAFATGTFNVKNINHVGNKGVEVVYDRPDGQETNFLFFEGAGVSTLTFDGPVVFKRGGISSYSEGPVVVERDGDGVSTYTFDGPVVFEGLTISLPDTAES